MTEGGGVHRYPAPEDSLHVKDVTRFIWSAAGQTRQIPYLTCEQVPLL